MITTGITGQQWRATVTPWGAIEPWNAEPPLNWFVAADDRWHVPADETTVRQDRLEGAPVVETRVRVPNGDVVQRIWSVADMGGITIVEVENESTMPVAVAFDRRDVLTERPIANVPIEGIDLPDGAFVLPLGHRATLRIGLSHTGSAAGPLPGKLSTPTQVVRGWMALTQRASRFVLPDGDRGAGAAEQVTAIRCEIALGEIPSADDDPVGFAVALGELVRMGEAADPWLPELVDAVERLGPAHGWAEDVALAAADRVLDRAGEHRARRDLARIIDDRPMGDRPTDVPTGALVVPWLESQFAVGAELLPTGIPADWFGQSFEVYDVPTEPGSRVSFGIRWHGARPAVLWEQSGTPLSLTSPNVAPDWHTTEATGDALWPEPPEATSSIESTSIGSTDASSTIEPTVAVEPNGPESFDGSSFS